MSRGVNNGGFLTIGLNDTHFKETTANPTKIQIPVIAASMEYNPPGFANTICSLIVRITKPIPIPPRQSALSRRLRIHCSVVTTLLPVTLTLTCHVPSSSTALQPEIIPSSPLAPHDPKRSSNLGLSHRVKLSA